MSPLPNHRPKSLSLGPLESEILEILWSREQATVREIHDHILSDPNRELAYPTITTVLNRLAQKGWVICNRNGKAFIWRALLTKLEGQSLIAQQQLKSFLSMSNTEVVAAFTDCLDEVTLAQLERITKQIKAARELRDEL